MRRATSIIAIALAIAAVATSHASAANTLEGTCTLSGRLDFAKPIGDQPRATDFRDHASGTCTGTLNGVPAESLPVVLRARGSGTLSCVASRTTSTGTLTFAPGTADPIRIRFWADVGGALTELAARFGGAVAGEGIAHVDLLPYADQSVMAACQSGTLGSARYDLLTRTITPVVG